MQRQDASTISSFNNTSSSTPTTPAGTCKVSSAKPTAQAARLAARRHLQCERMRCPRLDPVEAQKIVREHVCHFDPAAVSASSTPGSVSDTPTLRRRRVEHESVYFCEQLCEDVVPAHTAALLAFPNTPETVSSTPITCPCAPLNATMISFNAGTEGGGPSSEEEDDAAINDSIQCVALAARATAQTPTMMMMTMTPTTPPVERGALGTRMHLEQQQQQSAVSVEATTFFTPFSSPYFFFNSRAAASPVRTPPPPLSALAAVDAGAHSDRCSVTPAATVEQEVGGNDEYLLCSYETLRCPLRHHLTSRRNSYESDHWGDLSTASLRSDASTLLVTDGGDSGSRMDESDVDQDLDESC